MAYTQVMVKHLRKKYNKMQNMFTNTYSKSVVFLKKI